MTRIGPVSIAILGGIAFSGFFAVLLSSAAQAACEQWDLNGKWRFSQDNGFNVNFKFLQTGNVITGNGRHRTPGQFFDGSLNGRIDGHRFSFTVDWVTGAVGMYDGIIDDSGGASGRTRDQRGFEAGWQGNRAATCRVAAAEKPVVALGRVKKGLALGRVKVPPTTLKTPLEICVHAQNARKRNSPAAPGLERQCAAAGAAASDAILEAANQLADLTVGVRGPNSLQAGLSGTFTVGISNRGTVGATVELNIIFAGKLDQTGRIVAGAGLACDVVHDAGINAALRCTGGQLGAGESARVVVQGRGQEAGNGMLVATLNASRSVEESNYDNNLKQLNITID